MSDFMTIYDALEILQGKLDCMKKCDVFDCKNSDECVNCKFQYAQGTFGEQKEAFEIILKFFEPALLAHSIALQIKKSE